MHFSNSSILFFLNNNVYIMPCHISNERQLHYKHFKLLQVQIEVLWAIWGVKTWRARKKCTWWPFRGHNSLFCKYFCANFFLRISCRIQSMKNIVYKQVVPAVWSENKFDTQGRRSAFNAKNRVQVRKKIRIKKYKV